MMQLDEKIIEKFKSMGIRELNPPQKKCLEAGLLEGKNLVLASPTASGKTLVAVMASLKKILEEKKKAIYIVPLRSLAQEKYEEFKKYEDLGLKVAMSIGNLDSSDPWLGNYDLIIVTSEKADSLLRHNPDWVNEIGLVTVDEMHLLNDESRGPTLEVVITRLRGLNPQILGLSATIKNAEEIAGWLGGKAVKSDYRPVKLYQGVYSYDKVHFLYRKDLHLSGDGSGESLIIEDTLKKGKQALIFTSTRRNAESSAVKAGETIEKYLKNEERKELEKISEKILKVTTSPTRQCRKLASCVRKGSAFHHAGLVHEQKLLIEKSFKQGFIKVVSATPTLAMGINMPAWRVVIRDMKRYKYGYGSVYLPALEVNQMMGRAGRPSYDKEGEAILIAKNKSESEEFFEKYILGEDEEIYSKLSVEPVLRMHVLSLISTIIGKEKELMDFLSRTFFAFQYQDLSQIKEIVLRILKRLKEQKFITENNGYLEPTTIGKRVAELYLDPETAFDIIHGLQKPEDDFFYLFLISKTREMRPLRIGRKDIEDMREKIVDKGIEESMPSPWNWRYEEYLRGFKTALMMEDWINERREDHLLDKYNVTPGELKAKNEISDWLLYSCQELCLLLGKTKQIKILRKLRTRIKYGIRPELVPLIALKGVGRIRARRLFNSGFRKISDIRKAPEKRLTELIGPETAKKIRKQMNIAEKQKTINM